MSISPFPAWPTRPQFIYVGVDFFAPSTVWPAIVDIMDSHPEFLAHKGGETTIDWVYYLLASCDAACLTDLQEELIFLLVAADILAVDDGLLIHQYCDREQFWGPTLQGIHLLFHPDFSKSAWDYVDAVVPEIARKEANYTPIVVIIDSAGHVARAELVA